MSLEWSRPLVLLALFLLPIYALWRRHLWRRDAVPHAPLQWSSMAGRGHRAAQLRLALELLLLAALIAALAGPYRASHLELMDDEGVDVMLVLDVSLSMLAEDFPPNRLEALRGIARDFIHRAGSHRVGLVIFGKDVYVQSPLTTDRRTLLALLDSVTVHAIDQAKSGGTAIGDALLVASGRLEKIKLEDRDQALILITDGASNLGVDPSLAARYVRHLGIRFYAIGIGGEEPMEVFFEGNRVGGETPYLASLDDTQLRVVAEEANGRFYRAGDVNALSEIFAHLSRLESAPLEVRTVEIRRSHSSYLAFFALPLFVAYLVIGGQILRRPLR